MSAQSSGASGSAQSAPVPANTSGASDVSDNDLPKIDFSEPTDEHDDLRTFTCCDLSPESIPDGARISVPDIHASRAPNGNDYVSFGDEGTTVTVNAYGSIMQITRSLGYGHSGLFCVESANIHRPISPQIRLEKLMQMSRSPDSGIRLFYVENWVERASFRARKPKLEFVFNRWPRFTVQPTTSHDNTEEASTRHEKKVDPTTKPSDASTKQDSSANKENFLSELSLQYFSHKGTVFQRYSFNQNPTSSLPLQHDFTVLFIPQDFLIRTSDFLNDSVFNRADRDDDAYTSSAGPEGYSHVIIHKMTEADAKGIGISYQEYRSNKGPKAVALVITAFINGKAQILGERGSYLFIDLSQESRNELKAAGKVEITIGYRLQLLTNEQSWRQSMIPASALNTMGAPFSENPSTSFQKIRWSSHDHVDFITGRNLEHILSVCSIPVPKHNTIAKTGDEAERVEVSAEYEMDNTSLALTCGDISGHHIASSATLWVSVTRPRQKQANLEYSFAFEFLVELLQYLCDPDKRTRDYMHDSEQCLCEHTKSPIFGVEICDRCGKLEQYIQTLRVRILQTLEAHLKWSTRAKGKGSLDMHYHWITGEEIKDWQKHRCFRPASLTNTPFEIIKFHHLHRFYQRNQNLIKRLADERWSGMDIMRDLLDGDVLKKRLEPSIRSWVLHELYQGDLRCQYTYPHHPNNGNRDKKYHLADHAWIFRAFRCVEKLELEECLDLKCDINYLEKPELRDTAANEEQGNLEQRRRSEEFQQVVLKRFTTRVPESKQRILATSRTSSESRFLFHAKDTALFYAMEHGFFDLYKRSNSRRTNWTNKIAVWKETVAAQADHEETQALEWEKPLWYALALIISSRRKRINKASASEMLFNITEILFEIASSSGLFPGFLNNRRKPIAFEDDVERDKYWHATFEIPYALWVYGKEHIEMSLGSEKAGDHGVVQRDRGQLKEGSQLRRPMAKKMEFSTFNSLLENSRLVEVSDGWLREIPPSLHFGTEAISLEESSATQAEGNETSETTPGGNDISEIPATGTETLMNPTEGSQLLASQAEANTDSPKPTPPQDEPTGAVFDVPSSSSNRGINDFAFDLSGNLQQNTTIKEILTSTRTVQKAKKRLVWLPRANKDTEAICCDSSPEMEKDNLSAFFEKHGDYEKHFFDGTSSRLNEWVTELHLSYFRKSDWNSDESKVLEGRQDTIPESSVITWKPQVPGLGDEAHCIKIERSVMSFRFVGDFFDRYWTCHFLEFDPADDKSQSDGKSQSDDKSRSEDKSQSAGSLRSRLSYLGFEMADKPKTVERAKHPWQQRKVLELLLFDCILKKIHSSTQELLEWVSDTAIEKKATENYFGRETVSVLDTPFEVRATKPLNPLAEALQAGVQSLAGNGSDGYFSIVERWRFFEQVLQAMEEDLSKNLETISFWSSREKDREPELPRWTRNDELRYRQVINKLHVINQKKIRELEGLRVDIGAFRDSLSGKLETMRSDLEYRGSENINLFTYVTVVFLPLGFATGIFSMSGTPDQTTLANMINLALISIAITTFALSNAKTTGKAIVQPVILIFRFINNRFLDPLLKPFYIAGNILLYWLMRFEYLAKGIFYVIFSDHLEKAGDESLIKRLNSKSENMQKSYRTVVESNQQVLAEKKVLDGAKLARDFIEAVKEKPAGRTSPRKKFQSDVELGNMVDQENSATGGPQSQPPRQRESS